MMRRKGILQLLLLVLATPAMAAVTQAQEVSAVPVKASGVFDPGEKIEWKVEVKGAKDVTSIPYTIKKGGLTAIKTGTLELKEGVGTLESSLDEPGTLLVEFLLPESTGGGKPIRALAGAVVAPRKIAPSAPTPDDFDAFWKQKIDQLSAIPPNAKLEAAEAKATGANKPPIEYFKLQLDNIAGSHVYGQLAKPRKEGKYPALLLVQYAGVYALPPANVVRRAEEGWLCLNIMAHDLPFDQPKDFYDKQQAGPLNGYVRIGNESRDTSYFLRMALGCYRAADYLASRPDWDGKTLVVIGTSQGGMQAFMTAGLHPKITAMLANVPGGCDCNGKDVGRIPGWPQWDSQAWGRDMKKVMATSQYFDCVNFAKRIKCPAMVAMGLIDVTCPAAGVLAAANQIQGKTELVVMPLSDHQGTVHDSQTPFWSKSEAWLRELQKGEAAK